MGVVELRDPSVLHTLFAGWEETIIWSCLGGVMGKAYADDSIAPSSGQVVLGDFSLFSGVPDEALIRNKPKGRESDFIIMVPRDEAWADKIEEVWQTKAKKVIRYAIKKSDRGFQKEKLEKIANGLTEPFTLHMIDEEIYHKIMAESWSRDMCSQFEDYEDYNARGLGVAALVHGQVVSGASSYSVYPGGIEIEIDTKSDYRRRGAALACGARLILECLKRGLYPSWDAQNPGSVALAKKLGYEPDHEYIAYEIRGY